IGLGSVPRPARRLEPARRGRLCGPVCRRRLVVGFDGSEMRGRQEAGDPVESAVAAGTSTGIGAIIPLLPFFFLTGSVAIVLAAIISLIAHFAVGAAKSLFTLRSWWTSGLEMTLA